MHLALREGPNFSPEEFARLDVVDANGHLLGKVTGLMVEPDGNKIRLLVVEGPELQIVPFDGARQDGGRLVVAVDMDAIRRAPGLHSVKSPLPSEILGLFRHYGMVQNAAASE